MSPRSSTSAGFRRETPRRSCFPSPVTAIGPISNHCPPPYRWGGRRRWKRRLVGLFPAREVSGDTRRQVRGLFPSPSPASPSPTGRFAIDAPRGRRQPFCRQCEHPAEILFPPRARLSRAIAPHCLPPDDGGGQPQKTFTAVVVRWRQTMSKLV